MMRFEGVQRLIDRTGQLGIPDSTHELGTEFVRLARLTEKMARPLFFLGPLQSLRMRINKRRIHWAVGRLSRCWGQLSQKYEGLILEVHNYAGQPLDDDNRRTAFFAVLSSRAQTSAVLDPQPTCVAELLWEAATRSLTLSTSDAERLRSKFHLRAIVDRLPSSDARGTVLAWTFSPGLHWPITNEQLDLLQEGIDQIAEFTVSLGDRLENLTAGAISQQKFALASGAPPDTIAYWLTGADHSK